MLSITCYARVVSIFISFIFAGFDLALNETTLQMEMIGGVAAGAGESFSIGIFSLVGQRRDRRLAVPACPYPWPIPRFFRIKFPELIHCGNK